MPSNVFAGPSRESQLVQNEAPLLPGFAPDELIGRQAQTHQLADLLRPALNGKRGGHALLVGPPGTGKTTLAKKVLADLKEHSSTVSAGYVNAWENHSRTALLGELAVELRLPLQRRGFASDELFAKITGVLKNERKPVVLFVDEVDQLAGGDGSRLLYDLTRAMENTATPLCVVGITNDETYYASLDARVRSSWSPTVLSFKPYTAAQLKLILQTRAALAFTLNACNPKAIDAAANAGANANGDCRVAIDALHKAARAAERQGAAQIQPEHVQAALEHLELAKPKTPTLVSPAAPSALSKLTHAALEQKMKGLSEGEKRVLELLVRSPSKSLTSGALYEQYQKEKAEGDRSIRNHIEALLARKFIRTTDVNTRQGNTRLLTLNL